MKLLFLCTLLLSSLAFADNALNIALTHIPKVLEYQNQYAPYNRFIERLKHDVPLEYNFVYMPSSRSNKQLENRQLDCIFPIVPTHTRPVPTILSAKINGISAHLFSLGPKIYRSLDELNDQVVVHQRGYLFGDYIKQYKEVRLFPVTTHSAAIGVLQKNRAAALIDYIPDLRYVLEPRQMALLKYDPDSPLVRTFDHFECIDNDKTNRFMTKVNTFILSLQNSGELKTLLGDYYVEVNGGKTNATKTPEPKSLYK